MQRYTSALIILSTALSISACQPKAGVADEPTIQAIALPNSQLPPTKMNKTAATDQAVMAKDCITLNDTMRTVDGNSQIEAIYAIQDQLKTCLPTANNAEVMALLKSYQDMYSRFLASDLDYDYDSDSDFEIFNNAIYELYYGEGLSSAQLKTLDPRDQYLIGLVNSDADVRIRDLGEGYFSFDHDLKAMADIFTPYLRKDQSAFIGRMAIDNQEIFWSDASITTSFEELIERTTFWENYIQQYPDGYAVEDAKILFNLYQHALFFGSDNTQWTDSATREFLEPQFKQQMLPLLQRPNSELAENTRTYLQFMIMTDAERQQKYPVPDIDTDGDEIPDWSRASSQFKTALPILSPWESDDNRDCMSGLICVDYNTQ